MKGSTGSATGLCGDSRLRFLFLGGRAVHYTYLHATVHATKETTIVKREDHLQPKLQVAVSIWKEVNIKARRKSAYFYQGAFALLNRLDRIAFSVY